MVNLVALSTNNNDADSPPGDVTDTAAGMLVVPGAVPTDARQASQTMLSGDEEGYQDALTQLKMQALTPLVEDLSDWLNTTLGKHNFCVFYHSV